EARGRAYALGGGGANLESNVVTGMFLLNNHYERMLFDSGADRSFVSTTFSVLLDIVPSTLNVSYAVELADRRIAEMNTLLRGCTLVMDKEAEDKSEEKRLERIEGVIGLTRWFEKMEMVFHISNCPQKYQVKYASCTLQNGALTWWNSHKRTVGTDAAYAMTWKALMKLMTEVYCPRNEI
ncbi:hypothetical protein Tco_0113247, partial [Tanacetum coccineum]